MRLLIADDHTLFRDALLQYIKRAQPSIDVVLAKDFYEAKEHVDQDNRFDLVILDYKMPGMNGLEGLKKLKVLHPALRVAMMSGIAEVPVVQEALNEGAAGYFPKTLSGKALLQAVELVMEGQKYVPFEQDTGAIMPAYYDDGGFEDAYDDMCGSEKSFGKNIEDYNLTSREHEVLSYVMKGASNKEIANTLGLQEVTVKLHVRGICRKLGAKNRTQAAMRAKELGAE